MEKRVELMHRVQPNRFLKLFPFDLALGGQGVARIRGARFHCHRILIVDRSLTAAICGSSGLTSPNGETSLTANCFCTLRLPRQNKCGGQSDNAESATRSARSKRARMTS
eukprot:9481121-Pyramimonas_sp.AAC.1